MYIVFTKIPLFIYRDVSLTSLYRHHKYWFGCVFRWVRFI